MRPERHDQRVLRRIGKLVQGGKRWTVSHLYLDPHSRFSIQINQYLRIKLATKPSLDRPEDPR
jgi:hypothetical protein